MFKSRDAAALPALDRAITAEKGRQPCAAPCRAPAPPRCWPPTPQPDADKLAAIAILRARGDLDARGLLASLQPGQSPAAVGVRGGGGGEPSTGSGGLWSLLQGAFYGLSLGSVLLLAATGLAITFGVMGVINMAHGEMVMIGAYVTFMVQEAIRAHAPGLFGASLLIAVPARVPGVRRAGHGDRARD